MSRSKQPHIDQATLFANSPELPSTRYQGSKQKIVGWILDCIGDTDFESVLDAFGGTGTVSYALKAAGKAVTYNDNLSFNHTIGTALIQNSKVRLSALDADSVVEPEIGLEYGDFISRTFGDVYFTDEENNWLDIVAQNIQRLRGKYERSIAYYALFQSCIVKRPYNLFHRKNLYMRTSNVKRSFGNKATWDKPFPHHFASFVAEANRAVFDSGVDCKAICMDAMEVPNSFDLVYIDTPYINRNGVGVDYLDFYHFLEGILDYRDWGQRIDYRRKHKPLKRQPCPWANRKQAHEAFADLFDHFRNATLVVSYRSDGIPTEQELFDMLQSVKTNVQRFQFGQYKYALSKNGNSNEVLLIGK